MNAETQPFHGRRKDACLLTGAGRYTAELSRLGQIHAAFLRADRTHPVIRSIDAAALRLLPCIRIVSSVSRFTGMASCSTVPLVMATERNPSNA